MSSGTIVLIALVHCAVTPMMYSRLSPGAVWFFGSGLGLLLLGVLNWTHVGVEPCSMPTAPVVRWANVVFLLFGFAVVAAVHQPQALVVVAGLAGQVLASWTTLRPAD